MGVCSYLGCKNRSEDGFQFGSFPAKDKSRRNLWLKNCNYKVNNVDSPNIKLCHVSIVHTVLSVNFLDIIDTNNMLLQKYIF